MVLSLSNWKRSLALFLLVSIALPIVPNVKFEFTSQFAEDINTLETINGLEEESFRELNYVDRIKNSSEYLEFFHLFGVCYLFLDLIFISFSLFIPNYLSQPPPQ